MWRYYARSMYCPTCGNEFESDARFCGICGTGVSVGEQSGAIPSSTSMVSFGDAVSLGFKNYVKFEGRSTRAEYWWWFLFVTIVVVGLNVVDGIIGAAGILGGIFQLLVFLPGIALGARRLHDIDKSGWWQLLWIAVLIGWVILIIWYVKQGDNGPNSHGMDPRQAYSY